jgi:NTE family protein
VPVSLVRALGADIVIAVDLNADLLGRHALRPEPEPGPQTGNGWLQALQQSLGLAPATSNGESGHREAARELPSMLDTLATSIHIMQVRITRSRMSGEPPEFSIAPSLAHLGMLDFDRAREAIDAGEAAAQDCIEQLRDSGLLAAINNGAGSGPDTPQAS